MNKYRDGALACRSVLEMLPSIDWGSSEQTGNEYFAKQHAAIAAILSSAGPLSEYAAGAMASLAEVVVVRQQDKSDVILNGNWKPWAAMTDEEREARLQELE